MPGSVLARALRSPQASWTWGQAGSWACASGRQQNSALGDRGMACVSPGYDLHSTLSSCLNAASQACRLGRADWPYQKTSVPNFWECRLCSSAFFPRGWCQEGCTSASGTMPGHVCVERSQQRWEAQFYRGWKRLSSRPLSASPHL